MNQRPATLQNFIRAAHAAYDEFGLDPESRGSIARIFDAIESTPGEIRMGRTNLPVCSYLPKVMRADYEQKALRDLVDTFNLLEPDLSWRRRPAYDIATASDNFHCGHGNCVILGPGGFESRSDVGLGVTLLAPNVRYPDHDHPTEATYLVVSEGLFRQGDRTWFSPGVGGSFHNVPMIKHAMRSLDKPFLAFWALWMG